MDNLIIAYTLKDSGFLGYIPECVAIYTDSSGQLSTRFIKVTSSNKNNYKAQIDEVDEQLIQCCFKLESDVIVSKIKDKAATTMEALQKKYFGKSKSDPAIQHVREFITDMVNHQQNRFFDLIGDRRLFLPQGKFPFMWKHLFVEMELPELKYRFVYTDQGLQYSLTMLIDNQLADLKGSELVSLKRARILRGNHIFEFDGDVEGAKLVPFFGRDSIQIPISHTEEYLQKFVLPIISKNQIEAEGFTIQTIEDLPNVVLKISEVKKVEQLDIFDGKKVVESGQNDLQFELLFEYEDFCFRAGKPAPKVKMVLNEGILSFTKVRRDLDFEASLLKSFLGLGINLDGRAERQPYRDALDWINSHYDQIQALGIEVRYEKQDQTKRKIFVGNCAISLELNESNDWFDVRGNAVFGEFVIPILVVLSHIRHNKSEIRLPNGEYALIPQAWFDEYQTFTDYCRFDDKTVTVAKHHCAIADRLSRNNSAKLTLNDKLRKFIDIDHIADYELPKQFKGELRNYQSAGYNWLRLLDELGFGGCLADDMGLGKTIQTLCLLQWMKEHDRGKSLLVVPTSLVYNWQIEAARFCPEMKISVHTGKNRSVETKEFRDADLVITTYAVLRRDIEQLRVLPFHYLILDEAQAIKNPQSAVNQACLQLKANRFLTLTGTPVENSLTDLWSQIHLTNRNMLGDVNRFMRACKHPLKVDYFRQLIRPFVMRRLKSAVLTDLPEKSIFVQYCDMAPAQADFYYQIRNSFRDRFLDKAKEESNTFQLLEGLLRMRQSANHPVMVDENYAESSGKFDMVRHKLDEIIREGNKVLVFSSFVEHLKLYKNYLDERNISYCYLDGSTKEREKQVDLFQNSDDHQVFLLSLKAGGTGLNLTRAGYVFLLDPWWNPAAEAQAFDRAHRIGQKNKVFVYKFISRNSIEEKIVKLQEEKIELFNSIIEAEQDISKQFNREELLGLLV